MASPGKKAFALRLSPTVWEAVARLAASEMRSTNAQIEYLLREALEQRGVRLGKVEGGDEVENER